MLRKLLKYDLKYMIKNMSIFYILALFFAVLTRIFYNLEQSVMINIIAQITNGCLIAMIANTFINTMIRSWVGFRNSLYKDEGYLTHTLPVTKSQLYNSKFIQTLIFYFASFVVIVASLFIAYYSEENWSVITEYVRTITTGLNMSTTFFVVIAFVLVFLEMFNAIQCGFLGIILGYRKNSAKLGFSFLFGIVAYFVAQTIILGLMFIYGLFDPTVMALFETGEINIDVNAFKSLAIVSSVLYGVIIFGMSIMCKAILKKGVNLE